jgi:predicted nucleic acid-binding protein
MTKIYIDTNIFFNVWNEEIDQKSGTELWKSSRDVLEKTEQKKFDAITSITTIMEIVHVFRVRGRNYNEAIDDIKRLNVKINVPDSWVMIKALEYQMEYELDLYDSIAFAVAQTAGCQILVTRDEKIIKNIKPKMRGAKPEELLD